MKIAKKILFFSIITLICISLVYFSAYLLPPLKIKNSNQINIYDRNEKLMLQVTHEVQGSYLPLEEINPLFIDAFIASEDESFYKHLGFSIKGISRAIYNNVVNDTSQGGSTITQQVARSLFLDNEKSIFRKIKEAYFTIRLESKYSKDSIIEQYLNNIFLGHNIYGIESASKYYFSKSNKDLSIDEIAMIVGIANAPNLNAPDINYDNAIIRKNYVLSRMYKLNFIDKNQYEKAYKTNTKTLINKTSFISYATPIYFYAVNKLKELGLYNKETLANGINVYTTIDSSIQLELINSINKNNPSDNSEIASIILKTNSNDVLAISGGYDLNNQYNRAIKSIRPIGSTIKPLLYYLALKANISPDTFLSCKQKIFKIKGYENYKPSNASNKYASNKINMIEAIGLSDNIYATKILLYLGFDNFEQLLSKFNIETNVVPSSALGVDETSLINLASIYNTFASLGIYYNPIIINKITNSDNQILFSNKKTVLKKLDKPYLYVLNQLLLAPFDKNLIDYTSPTLLNYKPVHKFAGKTGSDDYNSYTVGFNPSYTIAIWTGTDNNEPFDKKNTSKIIFKEVANAISKENVWYNPPSYIEKKIINPITVKIDKNGSEYWFIK